MFFVKKDNWKKYIELEERSSHTFVKGDIIHDLKELPDEDIIYE